MTPRHAGEGLRLARLFMVLSSVSPLFVLWAIRGNSLVPDRFLIPACAVMVVVPTERPRRPDLAARELAEAVRTVAGFDIAAVVAAPALPVDKRHNSKIDRTRVATWASAVLAGGRMRDL